MAVHFLLDEEQKRKNELLHTIDELTRKQPYPNKETLHLALFINSCFEVNKQAKLKKIRARERMEELIRRRRIYLIKKREEALKLKELEKIAPSAPPRLPLLQEESGGLIERDYTLRLYNYPIGIVVHKDEHGRFNYKKFEPAMDYRMIEFIEKNFGYRIGENMNLLENSNFIAEVAYTSSRKTGIKIKPEDIAKVKYYLHRDALGGGVIDVLLFDENVKEIIVAGLEVTIVYGNYGRLETNVRFNNEEQVRNLIFKIANATSAVVDENNPMMNVEFGGFSIEGVLGSNGSSSRIVLKRISF